MLGLFKEIPGAGLRQVKEWLRQAEEEHGKEQLEAPQKKRPRLFGSEAMTLLSARSHFEKLGLATSCR